MDTIFTLGEYDDTDNKINLDDLYEIKQQHDLNTVSTYNKVISRIHKRIKNVSRLTPTEQFTWYIIPETIIGIPKFDHGACTAYIIDKLKENGFCVKYTHPNLLFISWKHWIPSYVRNEIKKKTGINVDGNGNKIIKNNIINNDEDDDPDKIMFQIKKNPTNFNNNNKNKDFKSLDAYKPSGNILYNKDLFNKIENKSQ